MNPHRRLFVTFVAALGVLAPALAGARAADTPDGPLPAGAVARLGTLRFRSGSPIVLVAYQAGGKQVLTVGQDAGVTVFDAGTGAVLRQFDLHDTGAADGEANVRLGRLTLSPTGGQVAVSGDGKTLAMLNRLGGGVVVWDVGTGKVKVRTERQNRTPSRLTLSADGSRLATVTYDQSVTVFDAGTGKQVAQFSGTQAGETGPRMSPYRLEFSPDGKSLALAGIVFVQGTKAGVVVWEAGTGKELRRAKDVAVDLSSLTVSASALAPDLGLIALPGRTAVSLVDTATGQEVRKLEAPSGVRPPAVAFSADGKRVAAMGGRGDWVRVWETATGKVVKEVGTVAPGGRGVGAAAVVAMNRTQGGLKWSPDGAVLAWGDGPVLRQLDLATGQERGGPGGAQGAVLAVGVSPDGHTVTTAGDGGLVQRWQAATGQAIGKPAFTGQAVLQALVSADGSRTAGLQADGTWRVEETATGKLLAEVKGELVSLSYGAALSADGRRLAVVNPQAGAVRVYDANTGREVKSLGLPGRANAAGGVILVSSLPQRLVFSPDGQYLMLMSLQAVSLYHLGEAREQRPLAVPDGAQVRHAAFTPDSRAVVVELMSSGQILLLEVATGRVRQTLVATGPVGSTASAAVLLASRGQVAGPALAVSPDARWLVQGRDDGKLRVWNLGAGKVEAELAGHRGVGGAVAFDRSGGRLVSGSGDTTALVWDARAFATAAAAAAALDGAARDKAWADLTDSDAARAFEGMRALMGDPKSAAFLRERLKPAGGADEGKIARLLADLDSDMFAVRDRASRLLEEMGETAVPSLRKVLKGEASAEVVRRVEDLLAKVSTASLGGEQLRTLRAIEVLERLATPDAVEALRGVAGGAAGALGTVQAKEALGRLEAGAEKKAGS